MQELLPNEQQKQMMSTLVRALPQMRKELGISQEELGRKIGKSRQTVSSIERGTVMLSWDIFLSIILFLKVNYNRDKKNLNEVERFLLAEPGTKEDGE